MGCGRLRLGYDGLTHDSRVKERGVAEDWMAHDVSVLSVIDVLDDGSDPSKSSAPSAEPAWNWHMMQLWAVGGEDRQRETSYNHEDDEDGANKRYRFVSWIERGWGLP
jgi:hypothetical protein